MNKLWPVVLVLLLACHGHSDRGKDKKPTVELPVPTKLPPAPAGFAAPKHAGDHAAAIDTEYATVVAMYKVAAGATPCESLYNAITAEQDAAKKLGRDSVFSFVAPKAELVKVCAGLPVMSQQCLVPSYQASHAEECESVKTPEADVAKMYVLRQDLQPPKESGQLPSQ